MKSQPTATSTLSPHWQSALKGSTLALSAIGLLADILGIGKLAYDVIVVGDLADLGFKLIVLVIVFLFGVGLGVVSIRGFGNISLLVFARLYAWVYVAIACLSYLGIAFAMRQQNYDFGTYVAFVLVVAVQLLAVKAMQVALEKEIDIRQFSIPILTICLIHAVLIVYTYVFAGVRVSLYLLGDLLFFTGMTLIGSAMLGDIGFRTMVDKLWIEISHR